MLHFMFWLRIQYPECEIVLGCLLSGIGSVSCKVGLTLCRPRRDPHIVPDLSGTTPLGETSLTSLHLTAISKYTFLPPSIIPFMLIEVRQIGNKKYMRSMACIAFFAKRGYKFHQAINYDFLQHATDTNFLYNYAHHSCLREMVNGLE